MLYPSMSSPHAQSLLQELPQAAPSMPNMQSILVR